MRYLILKPDEPIDPRALKPASSAELHKLIHPYVECEDERSAVKMVRTAYPGAVTMPFLMQIGSGQTVLLGVLADDQQRRRVDATTTLLNFALIVQPVPQDDHERMAMKRRPGDVFDRKLWTVPPERPDLFRRVPVELRSTDIEVPVFVDAFVGRDHEGRLVAFVEIGGSRMSMHFDNKALELQETKPADRGGANTPEHGYEIV